MSWRKAILIASTLVLVIAAALYFGVLRPQSEDGKALAHLFTYCLDAYTEARVDGMDGCWDWAARSINAYKTTVLACQRLAPDLEAPFTRCMRDEGIAPPGLIVR